MLFGVTRGEIQNHRVISLQSPTNQGLTSRNNTYFNVYRVCLCNGAGAKRNELISAGNDMISPTPRVCLCNRTRWNPAYPVPFPLPLPVLFHGSRMSLAVPPPVVPVCFSPSPLGITPVLHVLRILSQLLVMPSALALPLTVPSTAIALNLHRRTHNEQLATDQTTTTSCHETPPDQTWSIGCPFHVHPRVGKFGEHSNRWVSFREHRWVNFGERQSYESKIP